MIKIKIYAIGKIKEPWLTMAVEEYQKRLSSSLFIEWKIVRDDRALNQSLLKEKNYICLDLKGEQLSSLQLAEFLTHRRVKSGLNPIFVIGGPEGISKSIRSKATHLLSLSKLTFTHQMARLILVEQLYRSIQIHRGTKYHK